MATQQLSGCTKLVSEYTSVMAEQLHHEDSGHDSTILWGQAGPVADNNPFQAGEH